MYYLVVYSSVTFATRIKNYFRYDGDYMSVIHTPLPISKGGCSHSVKIYPRKLQQVLEATRRMGFQIKGVYEQTPEGEYIEVMV